MPGYPVPLIVRRTAVARPPKHSVDVKLKIVLSVLSGESTQAEAARRHGVSETSIGKWKEHFLAGGRGDRRSHARSRGGACRTARVEAWRPQAMGVSLSSRHSASSTACLSAGSAGSSGCPRAPTTTVAPATTPASPRSVGRGRRPRATVSASRSSRWRWPSHASDSPVCRHGPPLACRS